MRYRLRTLLIVLAVVPPLLAVAWWYGQRIPIWVFAVLLVAAIPQLLVAAFVYGFGLVCYLVGRLPGGRKDSNGGTT